MAHATVITGARPPGLPFVARLALSVIAVACAAAACGSPTTTPAAAGTPLPPGLPAGTYASVNFEPAVTFTVPAGWEKSDDSPAYLQLRPVGSELAGIHLFRDPVAASQDVACPTIPEPGVGGTSSQLAAWIQERPGLVVGNPKLASIGGLRGIELDVGIVEGWAASCPFADGIPTVPLFVGQGSDFRWVVAGSERLRLHLLDVPAGGTLVVDIDAFDGSLMDDLLNAATPIVQGMVFDLGG